MDSLMASLSPESKTLVKIITMVVTKQFQTEFKKLQDELATKDAKINNLEDEVNNLRAKVTTLESHIDDVEQYERRDTVIISGPLLPPEQRGENPTTVVLDAVKEHLKINMNQSDVSIAHRLGQNRQNTNKPIVVKLVNRSLKHDLKGACIQLKPQLYVNESLTPKRAALFKQVLHIRKEHKNKFQQCHTQDGKIIIKLKNSTVKHVICDSDSLMKFLDGYPTMKQTYLDSVSPSL